MSVNIVFIEYEGDVIGVGVIFMEIFDCCKSECDFCLVEEWLVLVCEVVNVGLWFWDLCINQLEWIECCCGIFGLFGVELVNYEIFSDLVYFEDKSFMELVMEEVLVGQMFDYYVIFCVLFVDNWMCWIEVCGCVFINNCGEFVYFMGVMVDVIVFKQNEIILQVWSDVFFMFNDNLVELVEVCIVELQQLLQLLIELVEKEKVELVCEFYDEFGVLLMVVYMEVVGVLWCLIDKNLDLYQQLMCV